MSLCFHFIVVNWLGTEGGDALDYEYIMSILGISFKLRASFEAPRGPDIAIHCE